MQWKESRSDLGTRPRLKDVEVMGISEQPSLNVAEKHHLVVLIRRSDMQMPSSSASRYVLFLVINGGMIAPYLMTHSTLILDTK